MAAQKGYALLHKIGDAASPEVFTTVAGLRSTSFTVNNETVDVTTKDNTSKWRQLLSGAGTKSLSISGSGVFTDAISEETVRTAAFANTINNFQILLGNGDDLTGAFQITSYERGGEFNGEETFSISLESSGDMIFTTA